MDKRQEKPEWKSMADESITLFEDSECESDANDRRLLPKTVAEPSASSQLKAADSAATSPLLPPAQVRFRGGSLISAVSEEESRESCKAQNVKIPLFTPGMVMSALWLLVIEANAILAPMHLIPADEMGEILGGVLLSISVAIVGYSAFCMYRLSAGMPFGNRVIARFGRVFYPLLGVLMSPLFLGSIAVFCMVCVLTVYGIKHTRDATDLLDGALWLCFVFPSAVSTFTVYILARRIQEAYCSPSMATFKRQLSAAVVAGCHVLPSIIFIVLLKMELDRNAGIHGFEVEEYFPPWEVFQTQLVFVSFTLGQFIPFMMLKSWLEPRKTQERLNRK